MTIEQLSAYLPYEIDIFWKYEKLLLRSLLITGRCQLIDDYDQVFGVEIKHIKPYLRPLSQLTETIVHEGKEVNVADIFWQEFGAGVSINYKKVWQGVFMDNIKNSPYTSIQYGTLQTLLQYHFNIFNLPESEFIPIPTAK